MDKTYELLLKIKARPEIYLGRPSLELLNAFLCGYCYYEEECQGEYQPDCLTGFNQYVQERHGLCTSHDWCGVILFVSYLDDARAFHEFYRELDEFITAKASGKFVAMSPLEKFRRGKE